MFAHSTVLKQHMVDQTFFSQSKTFRLFGAKNQNSYCFKKRAFNFQRCSKIKKVLLSTIHCYSSVLLELKLQRINTRVKFEVTSACSEYILASFGPFGLPFV